MNIRAAEKKDLQDIKNLQSKNFDQITKEDFDFLFGNENYILIVAEVDEKVIGYLCASISFETSDLLQVCVEKEKRRSGVAYKLIEFYQSLLKKQSVSNIMLEVNENNLAAINLYKKCGFVEINRRKNYYGKNSAVIMKKDL